MYIVFCVMLVVTVLMMLFVAGFTFGAICMMFNFSLMILKKAVDKVKQKVHNLHN